MGVFVPFLRVALTASSAYCSSYNNQWMIVDYKKVAPGQPIQPGTLTVLEEIPSVDDKQIVFPYCTI